VNLNSNPEAECLYSGNIYSSNHDRTKMQGGAMKIRKFYLLFCILAWLIFVNSAVADEPIKKQVTLHAGQVFQTMDGFGVNITPAQWANGHLRPVIDMLVDDLGCTLFRFDCWGKADWLDPKMRNANGQYPAAYLKKIYTGPIFRDAWETFRYLNSKNIEPFFNISGRIPAELAGADGQTLVDFDGYAEMAVTMLQWARNEEKLQFSLFAPFNETDLGFPEGPKLSPEYSLAAVKVMVDKMDQAGLTDVKLILFCDAGPRVKMLDGVLTDPSLINRTTAFSTHTYGDGGDQEVGDWFLGKTPYAVFAEHINNSPYKNSSVWMTEYGDLDQTGEVEFGFAWRSTRRLFKFLQDGFNAGLAWDAFDNLHEHDSAWATYGLFATDRETWTYSPKPRYYAAKQVYRFVKPGFQRVEIKAISDNENDVYKTWRSPLKHLQLLAFVSTDKKDFTINGMSTIESNVELSVNLEGLPGLTDATPVFYYRTSRNETCKAIKDVQIVGRQLKVLVTENSIFTLTTLADE